MNSLWDVEFTLDGKTKSILIVTEDNSRQEIKDKFREMNKDIEVTKIIYLSEVMR